MSTLLTTPEVDALKAKLKATWMAGDYDLFSRYLETDARVFYENLDVPSRCLGEIRLQQLIDHEDLPPSRRRAKGRLRPRASLGRHPVRSVPEQC